MTHVSPDDAARNLEAIEQVRARSSRAYGYQTYSRYLLIWGLVWIAGQGASLIRPDMVIYAWWILIASAVAATCLLPRSPRRPNWRAPAVVLIALAFVAAVHLALAQATPRLDAAVPPLVIAAIYTGLGLWLGIRFSVAGLVLAAFILAGLFTPGQDFRSWIGFAGGGALVLAGLWLRKV